MRYCVCGSLVEPSDEKHHRLCVANKPVANVANSVANKERPKADVAVGGSCGGRTPASANAASRSDGKRVEKWRESNRARYNERQRELMRKRRAGGISETVKS